MCKEVHEGWEEILSDLILMPQFKKNCFSNQHVGETSDKNTREGKITWLLYYIRDTSYND